LNTKKILYISSAGGHLKQLLMLEPLIKKYDSVIITEKSSSNQWLENDFNKVYFIGGDAKGRGFMYYVNIIYNFYNAYKIIKKEKPKLIISTGSYVSIPFFILSKFFKIKSIYILSFARIFSKSKASNLIKYFSTDFIIQWKEQKENYPSSIYFGSIY
jgi:UDP-N-acetylglucosamine:LPS N-acetylglucosamine transferase